MQRWRLWVPGAKAMAATAVVVTGMLLAIPPRTFQSRQEIGPTFNLLDGSWQLELPGRLARHQWSGRDFLFTYGPLYQLTHALGVMAPPGDLASLVRWHGLVDCLLVMLCVWLLLKMTGASLAWRGTMYLLWAWLCPPFLLSLSNYNVGIKPLAGLALVAACGYMLGNTIQKAAPGRRLATMALWALSAPLLFVYSYDLGILALAAQLSVCAVVLAIDLRPSATPKRDAVGRAAASAGASALIGFAAFAGCIWRSPWSNYLVHSWELVWGYALTLACTCSGRHLLLVAAAGSVAVLAATIGACSFRRQTSAAPPQQAGRALALLAAGIYWLAWTRTGLSRSDWNHIWPLVAISALLLGGVLACYLRARRNVLAWPLTAAWLAPLLLFSPLGKPSLVIASLGQRLAALRHVDSGSARLAVTAPRIGRAAAVARKLPQRSLYVWPYEAVVGLAAGKENVSYTVQCYTGHTDALQQAEVAHLRAHADAPVLLFTDSWKIDDVDNISRNSIFFQFLLDNYELDGRPYDGFILLRRSASARGWQTNRPCGPCRRFAPGPGRSLKVDLPAEPLSHATDLFKLRIRVAGSFPWPWGKPGDLHAIFTLSDGQTCMHRLIVPPDGAAHDVLVSACDPSGNFLRSVFDPGSDPYSPERVVAVELRWAPMDRLSLQPAEIVLERIEVLHRQKVDQREEALSRVERRTRQASSDARSNHQEANGIFRRSNEPLAERPGSGGQH